MGPHPAGVLGLLAEALPLPPVCCPEEPCGDCELAADPEHPPVAARVRFVNELIQFEGFTQLPMSVQVLGFAQLAGFIHENAMSTARDWKLSPDRNMPFRDSSS